jgi:mono/diheme cytochrome c family protein
MLLVLGAMACSEEPARPTPQVSAPAVQGVPQTPLTGEDAYRRYCVPCHLEDGRGRPGEVPALHGALDRSDDALAEVIRDGRPGEPVAMPAHGKLLQEAEIRDTIAYLRERFAPTKDAP